MAGSLLFGAFECHGQDEDGRWTSTVQLRGTDWGSPVPIEVIVESWLRDGALAATQGHDNTTMPLRLEITASDHLGLADAEKALFAEMEKPNDLVWDPQNEMAPTVFQVVNSKLDAEMDTDGGEVASPPRYYYSITVTRKSFVRSLVETVVPALAASGSATNNIHDGSTTTGVTATVNGVAATPSVTSGAVGLTTAAMTGTVVITETFAVAFSTASTKYVRVDWKSAATKGQPATLRGFADGVEVPRVAQAASPTAGYTRTWFAVPAAVTSVAEFEVECSTTGPLIVPIGDPGVARAFHVDSLDRTDIKPSLGTDRQLLRTIEVGGSASAPGTLAVEHETDALGDVMVYVWPDDGSGYSPPLRPYRVSGGTVVDDAALVSGHYDNLDTILVFEVPLDRLPLGDGKPHRLMLVHRSTQAGAGGSSRTLNWTASTRINGATIGNTESGSVTWTVNPAVTEWKILPIEVIPAQLVDVGDRSTAVLRVTVVDATVDTDDIRLDDAWLFDLTVGHLIACSCGTGTPASGGPSNRLFIQPPTLTHPRPRVLRGHAADGSDAFSAFLGATDLTVVESNGRPYFDVGLVNLLTVTTNALDAGGDLSYFKHWFLHPAEPREVE